VVKSIAHVNNGSQRLAPYVVSAISSIVRHCAWIPGISRRARPLRPRWSQASDMSHSWTGAERRRARV